MWPNEKLYLSCNYLNQSQDKLLVQLLQLQGSFIQVYEPDNSSFVLCFYIIFCKYVALSPNLKIWRLSKTFNQGQYHTNYHSFTLSLGHLQQTAVEPLKNSHKNYKQIEIQRKPKWIFFFFNVLHDLLQRAFPLRKCKDANFSGKGIASNLATLGSNR